MKSIVVTSVSSGIGYGVAKEFAEHGYRVFGSVRKEEDARSLKAELGTGFHAAAVQRLRSQTTVFTESTRLSSSITLVPLRFPAPVS